MNLLEKFTTDYYGARCFNRSYRWAWVDFDFNPDVRFGGCCHISLGREREDSPFGRFLGIGIDWNDYFGAPNRIYFHGPMGGGFLNLPNHRAFVETGEEYEGTPIVSLQKVPWYLDCPILHWTH